SASGCIETRSICRKSWTTSTSTTPWRAWGVASADAEPPPRDGGVHLRWCAGRARPRQTSAAAWSRASRAPLGTHRSGKVRLQPVERARVVVEDLLHGRLRDLAAVGSLLQQAWEVHLHRCVGVRVVRAKQQVVLARVLQDVREVLVDLDAG